MNKVDSNADIVQGTTPNDILKQRTVSGETKPKAHNSTEGVINANS